MHRQIDGRRVQRIDRIGQVDPQVLVAIESPRLRDQQLREIGIDPPVAGLVGIGQRAARDRAANPQMIEPAFLRAQAGYEVAQTLAEGQLRKGHAEKLVPTRKTPYPVVARVALHTLAKLGAG